MKNVFNKCTSVASNDFRNCTYEKEKNNPIWNAYSQSVVKKLGKPYGYKNLFKLYSNFKIKNIYSEIVADPEELCEPESE